MLSFYKIYEIIDLYIYIYISKQILAFPWAKSYCLVTSIQRF